MKNTLLSHNIQLKDVLALAVSLVSILGVYFALVNRINLLEQKQNQILSIVEEINSKMSPLYARIGLAESDIKVLESQHRTLLK